MDAVNVLTVGLNTLLDDDLNSLKVASPILNKCFQGHGAAVSWGHNSFVGGVHTRPHSWLRAWGLSIWIDSHDIFFPVY